MARPVLATTFTVSFLTDTRLSEMGRGTWLLPLGLVARQLGRRQPSVRNMVKGES
jgi:hypothetical protein